MIKWGKKLPPRTSRDLDPHKISFLSVCKRLILKDKLILINIFLKMFAQFRGNYQRTDGVAVYLQDRNSKKIDIR